MNAETVEIYALCDPDTGEVRYVGKAVDAKKRLAGHLRDSRRRNTPVYCWIRKIVSAGRLPALTVLRVVATTEWEQAERELIAHYRVSSRLLNLADGGDQPFCPTEVRAANGRQVVAVRTATPRAKRVYELKRNVGQLMHCRHISQESKSKLIATMKYAAIKKPDIFACWAKL